MKCEILINWNTNKFGECKRPLCQFKLNKGCVAIMTPQEVKEFWDSIIKQKRDKRGRFTK